METANQLDMDEQNTDAKALVEEAWALLSAAWLASNDERYDQLIAWAREIIDPLVAANYPEALWMQCSLPVADEPGIGEEESEKRHLAMVRKAAEAGNISAIFALACELDFDEEATKEEPARLFAQAAAAGDAYAQWCHGLNLLSGDGIEQDVAGGLASIRASAEGHFEGAINFLVDAYASGTHGYPKDLGASARWRKNLMRKDLIRY